MEEKLAKYRASKKNEDRKGNSLFNILQFGKKNVTENKATDLDSKQRNEKLTEKCDFNKGNNDDDSTQTFEWTKVHIILLLLKIILWLILFALCIEQELGAFYFVISLIYFLYKGTHIGKKKRKSLSAYSVFNPNFERLDGTFTTEQFEKELRYGAGSMK